MKVYATDDHGERFLRHVECDEPGCAATAKPGSDELLRGGWVKCGVVGGRLSGTRYEFCPEHARKVSCLEFGHGP